MNLIQRRVIWMLAALLLALTASAASANRSLTQTPTENQNATSAALTFTDEGSTFRIVCALTLELRELAAAIAKTNGFTMARANARLGGCATGRMLVASQPWTVSFISFAGTLPSITSVRLEVRDVGILFEWFSGIARCLYGGSMQGTTVGGTSVTDMRLDESRTLPLATRLGEAVCPRNLIFRGSFRFARTITLGLL